jgi:hypothetical protein
MEPEVSQSGAPADSGAPQTAQPQTTLSSKEQELLAQLPDFLVNSVSENDLHKAAGLDVLAPVEAPAPVAAAPAAEAAAPAAEAAPAPDPVQTYFDQQVKVNQQLFQALEALATKINPPPAAPEPEPTKSLEEMDDAERFVHLMKQDFKADLEAALKPFLDERAADKAAKDKADAESAFRSRADGIYQAADTAVGEVVGADKVAGLSAEDKRAVADEILSAQAAHAEFKDAQGNMVGISPSQAAAMVKARWARMARLFGAPTPQPKPGVPRALVAQTPHVGAPGAVQPTPFVDASGNQVSVPDARAIHKTYGGSTDKILDGLADGFRRAQPKS